MMQQTLVKYGESLQLPLGLLEAFSERRIALFVGAGVSMPAGAPGWDALFTPWRDRLREYYQRVDSLDLAQIASLTAAHGGGNALRVAIRKELQVDRELSLHLRLVDLPSNLILTTNYDPYLGQAAKKTGTKYVEIAGDKDIADFGTSERTIVHLYGNTDNPLATEEDLVTFSRNRPGLAMLLQYTLATRVLLFLGFSLRDYNVLNNLLNAHALLGGKTEARQHYAFMVMDEEEDAMIALWRHRRLEIFGYYKVPPEKMSEVLRDFVGRLNDEVVQKTQGVKRERLSWREEVSYFSECTTQGRRPVMRRETTFSVLALPPTLRESELSSEEGYKRGMARKALYEQWIEVGRLALILNATEEYATTVRGYTESMRRTRLTELKNVITRYIDSPGLEIVIRKQAVESDGHMSYATLGDSVLFESERSADAASNDPRKSTSVERADLAASVFNRLFDREMFALTAAAQEELGLPGMSSEVRCRAGKLAALNEIEAQLARLPASSSQV